MLSALRGEAMDAVVDLEGCVKAVGLLHQAPVGKGSGGKYSYRELC